MATLNVTSTPASIPSSSSGCIFSCTDVFYYGFGATAPSQWFQGLPNDPIDYGGAYGLVWLKTSDSSKTTTCNYFGV